MLDLQAIVLIASGKIEHHIKRFAGRVASAVGINALIFVVCVYPAERCGIIVGLIQCRLFKIKLVESFYILV